jgi:hypothetical protein
MVVLVLVLLVREAATDATANGRTDDNSRQEHNQKGKYN